MKKLLILFLFLLGLNSVSAEMLYLESNVNLDNYWQKNGLEFKKVNTVGRKLIHENGLKRAPIRVERNWRIPNAYTSRDNIITINVGMLPYIENDDQLAAILGHELAHAQDHYDRPAKLLAMYFNSKKYEYKADLKSIDYMVKAGYNPIAGIIIANNFMGEPMWDWGFAYTHPKTSNRMIKMYEYIYKKYPQYLDSEMTKSLSYQDFLRENEKTINRFVQKQVKKNNSL